MTWYEDRSRHWMDGWVGSKFVIGKCCVGGVLLFINTRVCGPVESPSGIFIVLQIMHLITPALFLGNELIPISPFHATASSCLHVRYMFNTCYRLFQLIYVIDMVASGQEQESTHVMLPESGEPKLYPPTIHRIGFCNCCERVFCRASVLFKLMRVSTSKFRISCAQGGQRDKSPNGGGNVKCRSSASTTTIQ